MAIDFCIDAYFHLFWVRVIVGLYDKCMFNLVRNCYCSPKWFYRFLLQTEIYDISVAPYFSNTWYYYLVFTTLTTIGKVTYHWSFNLHFSHD